MVLVRILKYSLIGVLLVLLSCGQDELDELLPADGGFATMAYFLDATLTLNDTAGTIEHIQLYADLDPQTPEGRNEFLAIEAGGVQEIYSVFFNDSTRLDTNLQPLLTMDNAAALYGSASYEGVGFCFYLPRQDAASSSSITLEDLLQPGQDLSLGQEPGRVEIGYFKNHPSAVDRADRGLVTNNSISNSGYLEILEVTAVQSGFGDDGFQVSVVFSAPLEQQLGLGQGGTLTGQARIFVPEL